MEFTGQQDGFVFDVPDKDGILHSLYYLRLCVILGHTHGSKVVRQT